MTTIRGTPTTHKAQDFSEEHKKTIQQEVFKEEHKRIYDAFLGALKSDQLDPSGKKVATFLYGNLNNNILNGVDLKRVNPLSEENFCRFLLAVFKRIKVKNLASEKNLENGEIQELVNKCISDARDTERNDLLIQGLGWFVGIKIDPKNIASSVKKGVLNKVPFLGNKEEEHELPKSDTELVTDALVKVFLPIFIFVITAIFFEVSTIMIIFGVIGLMFATGKAINSLFENTGHYPGDTQEVQKDWEGIIINDINKILRPSEKESHVDQQREEGEKKSHVDQQQKREEGMMGNPKGRVI